MFDILATVAYGLASYGAWKYLDERVPHFDDKPKDKDTNKEKENDPWGNSQKGNQEGPPDLDQIVKDVQNKVTNLFGGKSGGGRNGAYGFCFLQVFVSVRGFFNHNYHKKKLFPL